MIVKMKFLSITGPRNDFDRVTNTYLSKYEIQLENALSELKSVSNLTPFTERNPYKDVLAKANEFASYLTTTPEEYSPSSQTEEELLSFIRTIHHDVSEFHRKEKALQAKREAIRDKLNIILPFRSLQFDLHSVLQYKYIKFRFGRISKDYYQKLEQYIYNEFNVIFLEGGRDSDYIYGVYFASRADAHHLDAIFKSLHFERLFLPDEYTGQPCEACADLESEFEQLSTEINAIEPSIIAFLEQYKEKILGVRSQLELLSANFDVRQLAACVEDKHEQHYILCGWMANEDISHFLEDISQDEKIFVVVEDDKNKYFSEPPTKIENPKLFKPFETFTKMYGIPAHNEIDPTIFVAITYTFIFGVMFGDVGQGALLTLTGGLIYKFKKINLAAIIALAGVFSVFFGFMFGSIFGFETIIEPIWISPVHALMDIPFLGKLNTIFIVSIAFGMMIILFTMILHIYNAIKSHQTLEAILNPNGLIGLVFYGSIIVTLILYMTGKPLPATIVLLIMFLLPLILLFFKEPIIAHIEKRSFKTASATMFIVEGLFELFEILLSYFSNTLSFVRIGAFAISHASMMQVVLMLSGAETGNINWFGIIIGNIFVIGLEGLIVGIQVLRLEYYEIFSRFYKGNGREFKPYIKKRSK